MFNHARIVETKSGLYRINQPTINSGFAKVFGSRKQSSPHKHLDLEYRISSPSSSNNERLYRLNFEPYIAGEGKTYSLSYLAGVLAEQVMRIRTKELFRQIGKREGIKKGDFLKGDWNNGEAIESDKYIGYFIGRHNIEIYKKNWRTGEPEDEAVSELDGLYLYERENGKQGLVVTESKLGAMGHYSCSSPKNKGLVTRRIISPLKSFFPRHEHNVLLATPYDQTVTSVRQLIKKRFHELKNHLDEKKSQLILLPFNEKSSDFREMVRTAQFLREHYQPDTILNAAELEKDYTLVKKNTHTRFILKNDQIVEILERKGNSWQIVYEA